MPAAVSYETLKRAEVREPCRLARGHHRRPPRRAARDRRRRDQAAKKAAAAALDRVK
jgi:hypothetical protein